MARSRFAGKKTLAESKAALHELTICPLHWWQLAISPLAVSASADDFAVSESAIEIPAGQGVSGEASLELAAAPDGLFDEGDETVAIRFVPGGGVNARLGGDLEVVIHDAGVSPCPGANVVATRPEPGGPAWVCSDGRCRPEIPSFRYSRPNRRRR